MKMISELPPLPAKLKNGKQRKLILPGTPAGLSRAGQLLPSLLRVGALGFAGDPFSPAEGG